jgi:DnaJ-class molecular chaperone
MARAELCPVCKGSGAYETRGEGRQPCHGCGGKGWVTVGVEYPPLQHMSSKAPGKWISLSSGARLLFLEEDDDG